MFRIRKNPVSFLKLARRIETCQTRRLLFRPTASPRNNSLCCGTILDLKGRGRQLCTDATDVKEVSVDKRVYSFLEKWEVDNAINLVISGLQSGNSSLSGHVIIHLLGHLAEIGEAEKILQLEPYIQDSMLVSLESYYFHLSRALYNSGQIALGASYLSRILIGRYNHEHVNVIFTLLTVPTLLDFSESIQLYTDIVNEQVSLGDFYPVALLWKCYILCGEFSQAEELLNDYGEGIKSFLPVMMNEICQLKDKVVTKISHEEMLMHLLASPHLRKKKLRILVYRTLLQNLYTDSRWFDIQTTLMDAKDSGAELPRDLIKHHVSALQSLQNHKDIGLDSSLLNELQKWANTPETEQ